MNASRITQICVPLFTVKGQFPCEMIWRIFALPIPVYAAALLNVFIKNPALNHSPIAYPQHKRTIGKARHFIKLIPAYSRILCRFFYRQIRFYPNWNSSYTPVGTACFSQFIIH